MDLVTSIHRRKRKRGKGKASTKMRIVWLRKKLPAKKTTRGSDHTGEGQIVLRELSLPASFLNY